MQPAEGASQAKWNTLNNAAAAPVEPSDMMEQLLGSYSLTSESPHDPSFGFPSMFWSDNDVESSYSYSSDNGVGNILDYWPQGCGGQLVSHGAAGAFVLPPDLGNYHVHLTEPHVAAAMNISPAPMDFCMVEEQNDPSSLLVTPEDLLEDPAASMNEDANSEDIGCYYANPSDSLLPCPSRKPSPKRKLQVLESDTPDAHDKGKDPTVNPKKKSRASAHVSAD